MPSALLGKSVKYEKDLVIESRHKDLGLQSLGGDEYSGSIFVGTWMICGREYFLLYDHHVVHDVLLFPEHDKSSPQFGGACMVDGKELPESIYAVLVKEDGKETYPAKAAWNVDEKRGKFVKMPVEGMRCPRSGIIGRDK